MQKIAYLVTLSKPFIDDLDAPDEPTALALVVADAEQAVEGGLVELGQGGVVGIDALGQVLVQPLADFAAVALTLLFGEAALLAAADNVGDELHAAPLAHDFLDEENPVAHQAEILAVGTALE